MTRQNIAYIPVLSKKALHGKGTIQLRRNTEGELFFVTHNSGKFVTWHLYPPGEDWLQQHGYVDGDKIDLAVVRHLHRAGMSYTGGLGKKPATGSQPQATGTTQKFDWAQFNGIDKRLGVIRGDTDTICKDGPSQNTPSRDDFLGQRRPTHSPAPTPRIAERKPTPNEQNARNDLAQLFKETEEWVGDRRTNKVHLPPVTSKGTPETRCAPGPMRTRAARAQKPRKPEPSTQVVGTILSVLLPDSRDRAPEPQILPVIDKEEVVSTIMVKLTSLPVTEVEPIQAVQGPSGVPRKHLKKAAKRKKN